MILGRNKYSYPEDINDIIKKHKSNFFIAKDKVTKKVLEKLHINLKVWKMIL